MAVNINVEKAEPSANPCTSQNTTDKLQDMENAIRTFFSRLDIPTSKYNPEASFDELSRYLKVYDRILYSTISNLVYARYDSGGGFDPSGTILSNLDSLVRYSEDTNNIANKKKALSEDEPERIIDDTRKAVLKIWDHITLANHQYVMLKQSEEEYDAKFKKRISSFKDEMSKDMNAQMITMVGIFTALAFLVFGSISSLDGIFENIDMPLFKIMCIGLIWGLCISNMIFVFLYCIEKMTKLSFKANHDPQATLFQKYPIVWWTNLFLISLLILSSWGHIIQQTEIGKWLIKFTNGNYIPVFWIGTILILSLIIIAFRALMQKTKINTL